MRFSALMIFLAVLSAQQTSSVAQLTRLDDESAFSEQSIGLGFEEVFAAEVRQIGDIYRRLGLRFSGQDGSEPESVTVPVSLFMQPFEDTVLRNRSLSGDAAGHGFVIRFLFPQVRVGLVLGNGGQDTTASLRALTAAGVLLGEVEVADIDEVQGPFVGVETSHPDGISTLILDYGSDNRAEQINRITLDPLRPAPFRSCIGQIARGRTDDRQISTLLQIQSSMLGRNPVTLRFFDREGLPWPVLTDGDEAAEVAFELFRGSTLRLEIAAPAEIGAEAGYACAESKLPVSLQAVYRTTVSQESTPESFLAEAGVAGSAPRNVHVLTIESSPEEALDTGIAIVNLGEQEARIRIRIDEEEGGRPEFVRTNLIMVLQPGEHLAFFLSEFCQLTDVAMQPVCQSGFPAQGFRGGFMISSQEPTVVTTLRTFAGFPHASLSTGSTQE